MNNYKTIRHANKESIMKQELKDQWIAALRSGKYGQGIGTMKTIRDNKFCCLGVLCDTMDSSKWKTDVYDDTIFYFFDDDEDGCDGYDGTVPSYILPEWAMLKLIDLNDKENLNFNQIADWIEEFVPVD